jgi:hypothetical protein
MALTKIRGNSQILDGTIFDAQIADAAAIATTKLADGALFIKSDGSVDFTSVQVGVMPTADNHLATKEYVDNVATGLDVKLSVRAMSVADVTLSGATAMDGVAITTGDRVLLTGQTDATQNGIYVVNGDGAWARSADADNSPVGEVTSGMFTFVEEGAVYAGTGWVLTTANPIVLDTTELVFAQFSQAGVINPGAGLVKVGNVLNVVSSNGGIVVNADDIALTVDSNGTLAVGAGGIKLADLATGKILVGNGSNVATAVDVSGDATISSGGGLTISDSAITTSKIADAAVTEDKIADGAVHLAKLEALDSTAIIVGTGSGNAQRLVSGDATLAESGALTIANDAITTVKILDAAVTTDKLASSAVTEDKIADAAVTSDKIANQAVGFNQLLTLADAQIIIGTSGGNNAVVLSGDVTMDDTGLVTINPATVVRVADVITRETPVGTVDGVNMVFTLANVPKVGTESVFYNGLLQDVGGANDYTISGAVVTFTFAPEAGTKVRVSYFK